MRANRNAPAASAPTAERRTFMAIAGRIAAYMTGSGSGSATPPTTPPPAPRQPTVSFGAQSALFQGAVDDRSLKPWGISLKDFNRELTNPSWRAQLSYSRRIFANLSAVRGATCERARLAVGQAWLPIFTGKNKAWGKKATTWLTQWMKVCDVRGGPYDFRTDLKLMSIALDRDGDFGVNLVNDNPAWPHIQLLPAHRIASRTLGNDQQVLAGPYKGYWHNNGIISNDFGRTLALNVQGVQRGPSNGADQDRQISTFDCIHHYRPDWFEQGRGLGSYCAGLRDLRHMSDLRDLEFQAAAAQGTESIIVENDTGEPEEEKFDGEDGEDGDPAGDLSIETLAGGTIRYVRSGSGNGVSMATTTRPSPAWIGLMDHLERSAFAGMGWPKEYALDLKGVGGANTRAILDKCQYSIDERQADLWVVALRIICWAISVAIKNGILDPCDEWFMWEFLLPGELSVDDGRDRSNDRDDLRTGLTNKRRIFGRRGLIWTTETDQREEEVDDLFTRAERQGAKHPIFGPKVALSYLESHTPNGNLPDGGAPVAIEPEPEPEPAPAKKAA